MTILNLFPKDEKTKLCPTCKVEKPIINYWKAQSSCIECAKYKQKNIWHSRSPKKRLEQHLKHKYGVSHSEFMQAWDDQNGKCAICEEILPDLMVYENRRRGYAIDHNHASGAFRGILCIKCNTLLGMAKDNKEILSKAINYLENKGSYGMIDNMNAAKKR